VDAQLRHVPWVAQEEQSEIVEGAMHDPPPAPEPPPDVDDDVPVVEVVVMWLLVLPEVVCVPVVVPAPLPLLVVVGTHTPPTTTPEQLLPPQAARAAIAGIATIAPKTNIFMDLTSEKREHSRPLRVAPRSAPRPP
jgi:hypothetical protein